MNGKTPAEGEIFRNPDLAHTLSLISKGGRDAYYKGEIAHKIDTYFKRAPFAVTIVGAAITGRKAPAR